MYLFDFNRKIRFNFTKLFFVLNDKFSRFKKAHAIEVLWYELHKTSL